MWLLRGDDVLQALQGHDQEIVRAVRAAYIAHGEGRSSLPPSSFLRFPGNDANRIIALPAHLADDPGVTGIKWIASFPGNVARGVERASAIVVLNSLATGQPEVILEGSVISAKRTGASAVLAAETLAGPAGAETLGVVGCGLINFEIAALALRRLGGLRAVTVFDVEAERARRFAARLEAHAPRVSVGRAAAVAEVLAAADVCSIATTASACHLDDLGPCRAGATILHVSLRDLTPRAILAADNVVDDVEHVCQAGTSVHLAAQQVGHRRFIRCTLADVLRGAAPPRRAPEDVVVFSPFGLGVLDLAVARLACSLARDAGLGTHLEGFFPAPWHERGAPEPAAPTPRDVRAQPSS